MAEKEKKKKQEKVKYGFPRRKRGGALLTREQVREIKAGRKKLRHDLRQLGEKDKKEFELTASSMGLYFDKSKFGALFRWFFAVRGGWILLAAALLLLGAIYAVSVITQMKGHFTVNMSDDMFKHGFNLSEDKDFKVPTAHLFSTPASDVPCISVVDIPEDIDRMEDPESHNYYAYTFYLKNEGIAVADYSWEFRITSESKDVSKAIWLMVFEDGEMEMFAKANDDGTPAALPAKDNSEYGYLKPPMYESARDKEAQYEVIAERDQLTYWRIIPTPFVSDSVAAAGESYGMEPGQVRKYTVVLWLEGDDPDCTEELVSAHLGLELYISLLDEELKD